MAAYFEGMGRRKDGLTLREIRERLGVPAEEVRRAKREGHYFSDVVNRTGLAFRCACCSGGAMTGRVEDIFYTLEKETTEFGGATLNPMLITRALSGAVVRTRDLGGDQKPEHSSVPHITRDGLVCQHCYDSVYTSGDLRHMRVHTLVPRGYKGKVELARAEVS